MHIHLVVEASSRQALSRGMQGFKIRVARAINTLLGRSGQVFKDRYHDWITGRPRTWAQAPPTGTDGHATVATALTWLLRGGWKRGGGLLSPSQVPGGRGSVTFVA